MSYLITRDRLDKLRFAHPDVEATAKELVLAVVAFEKSWRGPLGGTTENYDAAVSMLAALSEVRRIVRMLVPASTAPAPRGEKEGT